MSHVQRPSHSVTQRDIARALGISHATVSLALRNSQSLSTERREEVQLAAKRMGYRPNAIATELARLKQRTSMARKPAVLAWIDDRRAVTKSHKSKQLDACRTSAEEVAGKLGYVLEEIACDLPISPASLRNIVESKDIRGICVVLRDSYPDPKGFPTGRIEPSQDALPCVTASPDHVSNAILAFARMRGLGYQRIGFLTTVRADPGFHASHLNETGFLTAQQSVPSGDRMPLLRIEDATSRSQSRQLAEWVRANRIDAVLTDLERGPEITACNGLSVPGDVGLACLGVTRGLAVAGVDPQYAEIGRAGLSFLHSLVAGNELGVSVRTSRLLLAGAWIDGDSLPDKSV